MAEEAEKQSGEEQAQEGGGGGMPMGLFLGVAGGLSVLLLGGGFAIAYFVMPGRIASIVEEKQVSMLADFQMQQKQSKSAESDGGEAGEGGYGDEDSGGKDEYGDKGSGDKESGGSDAKDSYGGDSAEEDTELPLSEEFILSEVIVNLAGSRGGRFVKASLFFDGNKVVLGELESQRSRVLDVVAEVLSGKTIDHFNSPGIRGQLRRELIAAVNATITRGKIDNIYFESLLVQ
ncbi:MAG: flagellar basal body-associated FliL family protein [Verrucomicrobiota bacterium]